MSRVTKSWREKLAASKGLPKVERISGGMAKRWGEGTVALPSPAEVDALMKLVPMGMLTTVSEIRQAVARKHHATIGCPLVTGIFAWIAAHAAEEAALAGEGDVTPYWRTLKTGGQLNPKFPGGVQALKAKLAAEGHSIAQRGKNHYVVSFERSLFRP
jgi:hypothetical protein